MLMQRVDPPRIPALVRHHVRRAAMAMIARCLTAFLGGYAFTAALVTLVARLLPILRVEATVWPMVPAFLVYAVIALWCFHEPRLTRVAALVWGGVIVMAGAVWLIGVRP